MKLLSLKQELENNAYPGRGIVIGKTPDGKKVSLMYRRDIPQYRTPFLMGALNLFSNWRLFEKAPPSGTGWANERNVTVRILQILESEYNKYDAWEREVEDAKRKRP